MSKGRAILAAAFAAVLCLAACNKENTPADPEPSAEIKNQIEYSEEPLISIKSVIYEAGADGYTFYLSTTEGITNVAGMQKASDYALVKTASVKGKVNTETENFEVSYKDITAKKGAMDGIRKAALSVNLLSKTSVEISADVITAERKPLFVRYNGACAKALADLSNQVELNQETTTTIASSTAWRYNLDGKSVYSLYEQSNVSKPADATPVLTISISDDADIDNITNLDLSAVSADDIAISYGGHRSRRRTQRNIDDEHQRGGDRAFCSHGCDNRRQQDTCNLHWNSCQRLLLFRHADYQERCRQCGEVPSGTLPSEGRRKLRVRFRYQ